MASKFRYGKLSIVVVSMIFLCINTILCDAQVTFSRDWNAGKRTVENSDIRGALKSATSLCHLLVSQIRQLATCETNHGEEIIDAGPTQYFPGQ